MILENGENGFEVDVSILATSMSLESVDQSLNALLAQIVLVTATTDLDVGICHFL
jgi:hypothetical protein